MLVALCIVLWSINSGNNIGLMLGCTLGASGFYGMLQTASRLFKLRFVAVSSEPAQEAGMVSLRLRIFSPRKPDGLLVESGDRFSPVEFDISGHAEAVLLLPAGHRGIYHWPLLRVSTRRPYGMGTAWCWFWPIGEIVVWPRPENAGLARPSTAGQQRNEVLAGHSRKSAQAEEWSHLREYRAGDRWRDVDWKRSAKSGSRWVRQYDQPPGGTVLVEWSATEGMEFENRIRRLARWINEAEGSGQMSTMVLPGKTLGPAHGIQHHAACMTALSGLAPL